MSHWWATVFFFLWQKVLWKIKEADVEDQWRGGSTGKPRAHLREHACQFRLSTVWLEGSPAGYNSRTDLHFTHTQTHWEAQRNTHTHTHNCQCFCYIFVWSGKGSETTSGSTEDTKNSKWNPEICSGVSTLQGRESNFTNLMGNSGIPTSTHLTAKWRQVQTHNLNQNQDTAVYIVTAMAGLVRYYDKGHREVWFFLEFVYILW